MMALLNCAIAEINGLESGESGCGLAAGNEQAQHVALEALRPAAGGLLWRTSKADVADELGIPPQSQKISSLHMSPVERHFYARQHQVSGTHANNFQPVLRREHLSCMARPY